jgi:hypothetical protein
MIGITRIYTTFVPIQKIEKNVNTYKQISTEKRMTLTEFVLNINVCLFKFKSYAHFRTNSKKENFIIIDIGEMKCAQLRINDWFKVKNICITLSNIMYDIDKDSLIHCHNTYSGKHIMEIIDNVVECICDHIPPNRNIYMRVVDESYLVFNGIHSQIQISLAVLKLIVDGQSWFNSLGYIASDIDGYPDEDEQKIIVDEIENYRTSQITKEEIDECTKIRPIKTYNHILDEKENDLVTKAKTIVDNHDPFFESVYPFVLSKWIRKL